MWVPEARFDVFDAIFFTYLLYFFNKSKTKEKKDKMEPNPFADEPDDLHSEVESLTEDDDLPELPGSPRMVGWTRN